MPARVAAVCCFRVVDPAGAVTEIEAFAPATSQITQTTLRVIQAGLERLAETPSEPRVSELRDRRRSA